MTYTAKTPMQLRNESGTLLEKMGAENARIDAEIGRIGTEIGLHKRKFVNLTPAGATLEASGIDLGTAADIEIHGHFFPKAVTLVAMHDYITEVYAKDATDAKIEIVADDATVLVSRTLDEDGEAAGAVHATPPTVAAIAAGTGISLKATNTGVDGTGHAIVVLEYLEA